MLKIISKMNEVQIIAFDFKSIQEPFQMMLYQHHEQLRRDVGALWIAGNRSSLSWKNIRSSRNQAGLRIRGLLLSTKNSYWVWPSQFKMVQLQAVLSRHSLTRSSMSCAQWLWDWTLAMRVGLRKPNGLPECHLFEHILFAAASRRVRNNPREDH